MADGLGLPVAAVPAPAELRRWALFLDVDGTLLELAPTPDGVVVPPDLPGLLAELRERLGGALALVSGRRIEELDGLFAPVRLAAAGVHGAFLRRSPDAPVDEPPRNPVLARLAADLRGFADDHPGVLIEDKGVGLAVHYRNAPDAEAALRGRIGAARAALGPGIRVLDGKKVIELKPAGTDKGSAIRSLMAEPPFAGRVPVFLGDDVTDRDGFRAVQALGGLAVQVGDATGSPAGVGLADPCAVRAWLVALRERLSGR